MKRRMCRGAVVLLSIALLGACAPGAASPSAAPGASVGQQLSAPLPTSVLDAPLVSSAGRRLTLGSLKGKVLVISDMMTLCQESCPLDTANLVAAARAVQHAGYGRQVAFLSISIDPSRDTPARLAAYRQLYAQAPSDWMMLTGEPGTLAALWRDLGVYVEQTPDQPPAPKDWLTGRPLTYDLTHSDEVFFLDTHARERFLLEGTPHVAAGAPLPATLRDFLDRQGSQNLDHPDPRAWTLPQELQVLSWLIGHRIATSS